MNRLIGDLLDQARVNVGALSLEVVTFDLGVATAITIGLHEHEDTPRITFATPKTVRIQGDPERIAQILGNLLDNARKYSPPGSGIDVSLTVVGTEAQIRVTDRGVGVPDDERDRIFAPFYRTSRTRDIPGTGLGLHISRRIADQHHGRLWLESSSRRRERLRARATPRWERDRDRCDRPNGTEPLGATPRARTRRRRRPSPEWCPRVSAKITYALALSLRQSEALGLMWDDVDVARVTP